MTTLYFSLEYDVIIHINIAKYGASGADLNLVFFLLINWWLFLSEICRIIFCSNIYTYKTEMLTFFIWINILGCLKKKKNPSSLNLPAILPSLPGGPGGPWGPGRQEHFLPSSNWAPSHSQFWNKMSLKGNYEKKRKKLNPHSIF